MIANLAKKTLTAMVFWSKQKKRLAIFLSDTVVLVGSLYIALAFYHRDIWPIEALKSASPILLLALFTIPISLSFFGLYRHVVRYASAAFFVEAVKGIAFAAMLVYLAGVANPAFILEPIIYLAMWALVFVGLVGSRLIAKQLLVNAISNRSKQHILIFGAGRAGAALLNALDGNDQSRVVGLIDDNKSLAGRKIGNKTIHHSTQIPDLLKSEKVDQIILAIASLSNYARSALLHRLEQFGVHVRVLPGVNDLVEGKVELSEIREVDVTDLLGRSHHQADEALLARDVRNKTVMVTGGGGSIGSELCRQAQINGAKRIVIYENTEFNLYTIEKELLQNCKDSKTPTQIIPVLGDVCNQSLLSRCIHENKVNTLYHAAAYKHVPMVEANVTEGVRNNVFGTLSTAIAAREMGVEKFVLISTDKAVRPTSVMGASKRLSEMILQALQQDASGDEHTVFTMVRFGNVLDSAGSVIPLFRQQIRQGGPVTVTHNEITRYFMTIPEAAQLVLQAGAIAEGGEVFLLDMGEPVRIFDLAKRMIRLTGLRVVDEDGPGGDIEIAITGLRPGEKLYEELFITDDVKKTAHPSIVQATEEHLSWNAMQDILEPLKVYSEKQDREMIRDILSKAVPGFGAPILEDPEAEVDVNEHTSNQKTPTNIQVSRI